MVQPPVLDDAGRVGDPKPIPVDPHIIDEGVVLEALESSHAAGTEQGHGYG